MLKECADVASPTNNDEEEVNNLVKEKKKSETQFQHQCHLLNVLISDNNKLKDQVNTERSKRAIYFNIYKNLEHEIHMWEGKYKNQLIETLKSEGVLAKMKEKFNKSHKKMRN